MRQQHPAGERVDIDLRRAGVVDVVRYPDHPFFRQRDESLPAAVTRYRQRASAGRASALRIDDDAYAFIARHLRQGDAVRVLAVNRDQVGRVDRGIAHLQQQPAGGSAGLLVCCSASTRAGLPKRLKLNRGNDDGMGYITKKK